MERTERREWQWYWAGYYSAAGSDGPIKLAHYLCQICGNRFFKPSSEAEPIDAHGHVACATCFCTNEDGHTRGDCPVCAEMDARATMAKLDRLVNGPPTYVVWEVTR